MKDSKYYLPLCLFRTGTIELWEENLIQDIQKKFSIYN
jgi:hypothetical protein